MRYALVVLVLLLLAPVGTSFAEVAEDDVEPFENEAIMPTYSRAVQLAFARVSDMDSYDSAELSEAYSWLVVTGIPQEEHVATIGSPDETGYSLLGEMVPGTFAEQIVVPAENCYPKPASLSWTAAAAFPLVMLTAWRMIVSKASLQAGEWVLIHGIGGGVSLAALQIARHLGARAIVTSHSDTKRQRAREFGAENAVDYNHDDVVAAVRACTEGVGADVVIDNVGEATFDTSIRACRKGGRIITCGATSGPKVLVDVRRVFWRQVSIMGSTMGNSEEFRSMLAVIESGEIVPVTDQVFPLAEGRAALEHLETAEQFGKVVLDIDSR